MTDRTYRGGKQKSKDIVVFWLRKDSECGECGEELGKGRFLRMEKEMPLCMECADLAHLRFVASGDACITRRARKYSKLSAVVVRFARARRRYERQGILAEPEAIERAEQECLDDAEFRLLQRERAAEKRIELDAQYVQKFARQVKLDFPGCPDGEETVIAEHACRKYSGRVGRSAAAKEFAPKAIELAVAAHVRHGHTEYDELLASGHERLDARQLVRHTVINTMERWRGEG
jgi:hypothetical protein